MQIRSFYDAVASRNLAFVYLFTGLQILCVITWYTIVEPSMYFMLGCSFMYKHLVALTLGGFIVLHLFWAFITIRNSLRNRQRWGAHHNGPARVEARMI